MQTLRQKYLDACLSGDTDTIRYMIKTEDLNFRNNAFLIKCLKYACEGNHIDIYKIILCHQNTVKKFSYEEYRYVLLNVCRIGNLNIYKFCMNLARHNLNDNFNDNLLLSYTFSKACGSGNTILIKYILDNNINTLKSLILAPGLYCDFLYEACRSGNIEIVNMLIEHGSNNWNEGLIGICGGYGDNVDIAKFMIHKGGYGVSFDRCMYEACSAGNIKIINLLIEHGSNHWDDGLYGACREGRMNIIELMIAKGATDWNRGMCGACACDNLDVIKFMISKGANDWNRGLCYAGRKGKLDIVKFMLLQGSTNFEGCLVCACICGDIDFAKMSVENGAIIWDEGFLYACIEGHLELIQLLVDCGVTCINDGLLLNRRQKNTNVCALLIKKGADILMSLRGIRDFRLSYLYNEYMMNKFAEHEYDYMDLLPEYPPCVLFVGSRLSISCSVKRLPVELFKMLVQYI